MVPYPLRYQAQILVDNIYSIYLYSNVKKKNCLGIGGCIVDDMSDHNCWSHGKYLDVRG